MALGDQNRVREGEPHTANRRFARTPLFDKGRIGEESAAHGLADYLEERSQG